MADSAEKTTVTETRKLGLVGKALVALAVPVALGIIVFGVATVMRERWLRSGPFVRDAPTEDPSTPRRRDLSIKDQAALPPKREAPSEDETHRRTRAILTLLAQTHDSCMSLGWMKRQEVSSHLLERIAWRRMAPERVMRRTKGFFRAGVGCRIAVFGYSCRTGHPMQFQAMCSKR